MLPPTTARAAVALGRLAARGLLWPAECAAPLQHAAAAAAPGRDAGGMRMRLMHLLHDAAMAETLRRAAAAEAVRRALRPGLQAGHPGAALRIAAQAANGGVLSAAELAAVAAAAIAALGRRRGR